MAVEVDLADLVSDTETQVNPSGEVLYEFTQTQWVSLLRRGFWEAYLDGLITDYRVDDYGIVTPTSGSDEPEDAFPAELQQLVIFYVGVHLLTTKLHNMETVFRAKSGPNEYEVQHSASLLRALLNEYKSRREYWLMTLSQRGMSTSTFMLDNVIRRTEAIDFGDQWFVR